MVSKYDVFYTIATKGELRVVEIVDAMNKTKNEYQNIFNKVLELEKEKYIQREKTIKIVYSEKSDNIHFKSIAEFSIFNEWLREGRVYANNAA